MNHNATGGFLKRVIDARGQYLRASMSQLRLDPLTGRWVVIAAERAARPDAFVRPQLEVQADASRCPFCPGNEEATPPALETYGPNGSWLVRVVPNLYPAFAGDEPMAVTTLGPVFTQAPASGKTCGSAKGLAGSLVASATL